MRPIAGVSARGSTVSLEIASKAATVGANVITLQNEAAHATGVMVFSFPAQPSHLPCIGISVPIEAVVASMLTAWTVRVINPVARATERTITSSRRAVLCHIRNK